MKRNWTTFVKKKYVLSKKPFVNLEDYRKRGFVLMKSPDGWPCIQCEGRGGFRDPKDLDPVEGYKLAPLYKCQACQRSGVGDRSAVLISYRKKLKKWRDDCEKLRTIRDDTLKLVSRLSTKNMELMRKLFSNHLF